MIKSLHSYQNINETTATAMRVRIMQRSGNIWAWKRMRKEIDQLSGIFTRELYDKIRLHKLEKKSHNDNRITD